MSLYQFAPTNNYSHNHNFITWEDAFTNEELDKIKEVCLKLSFTKASIGGKEVNEEYAEIRESKVAWLTNTEETSWIYDRLAFVSRSINSKFFGFDLFGFVEDMQFTEYVGETEGHYTWHQDMSETAVAPRKLSLVLQLSDPIDYEGGELQTLTSSEASLVDKKKGLIAAFPSWVLHRVTPVTKGTRHTLVIWVCGQSFK